MLGMHPNFDWVEEFVVEVDLLLLAQQLEQAVLFGTLEDPSSMGKEDLAIGVCSLYGNGIPFQGGTGPIFMGGGGAVGWGTIMCGGPFGPGLGPGPGPLLLYSPCCC